MKRSGIILSYPDAGSCSGNGSAYSDRAEDSSSDMSDDTESLNECSDSEDSDSDKESKIPLSEIIFHNIPAITKLINALYSHSMTSTIMIGAEKVTKTDAAQREKAKAAQGRKADSYLCNGILDTAMMKNIIPSDEGSVLFPIAIKLLQKFRLVYGPSTINRVENYLIPYFIPAHEFVDNSAEIRLQCTMTFCGLRVPRYAFHQLTVVFLQKLSGKAYQIFPYGNGASARLHSSGTNDTDYGEMDVHLIHEIDDQRVSVKVEGDASCITLMWDTFQQLMKALKHEARKAWRATITEFCMTCPHCLMLERASPSHINAQAVRNRRYPSQFRNFRSYLYDGMFMCAYLLSHLVYKGVFP